MTDELSKKMCESIKEQVDVHECIKDLVKKSLQEDVFTQDIIKSIIWKNSKTIGGIVLTIIGIPLMTALFTKLFH